MAEYYNTKEIGVAKGESIIFENNTDASFDVSVGIIFHKSGLYDVAINDKYITVSKVGSTQSEIIRCKDCKHWDTTWQNNYAPNYHYCPLVDGIRRNDFYCADADMREGDSE